MKSIQQLREQRHAVVVRARKILDDNPGSRWTAEHEVQVDKLYAEIDIIDRDIRNIERSLGAEACVSGLGANSPGGWIHMASGEALPVAYSKQGSLTSQLAAAFPNPITREGPRATLADFMRGVAGAKATDSVRNSLSEGVDSEGGFSLPAFLQLAVLDALAPVSSLMVAGAGVTVLTDGAKSYRAARVSTIPTAAWRPESGTVADSGPAFTALDIVPRSLSFLFKVSRELLTDSANMDSVLYTVIAQAFAKELDRAGLRGSGTAPEILGILNTPGIQSITNGANGASLATTRDGNMLSAMQAILAANGPMPSAAIMSPRSFSVLTGLKDTIGQPIEMADPIENDWDLISTSQIPNNLTVGTSTDCSEIYVGEFSKLVFFMRQGISVQRLAELFAATGQIAFVCHLRVDVGVLYPAVFAVATGVRP